MKREGVGGPKVVYILTDVIWGKKEKRNKKKKGPKFEIKTMNKER
jgi:hypothetical protein